MKVFYVLGLFLWLVACQSNNQNQPSPSTDSLQTTEDIRPNHKEVLYYDGGQIKFIQEYYNGIKHGIYKNWYENGSIRTLGSYYMGFRKGLWSWYNERGKLEFQVNYDSQLTSLSELSIQNNVIN